MSSADRLSPLVVFMLVAVAVLLGSASEALAQAAAPQSSSGGTDVGHALWDALTKPRTLIPLVGLTILFIGGLINGEDESWLKLFGLFTIALVVAIVLFEARPAPTGPDAQPPHPSKLAAGLGTGGVLIGALILLLLKYTRPLFFASTEVAFSLAVIYFTIRSLDGGGEKWATLVLGAYGVVDGIDRVQAEIRTWGEPAAKPGKRAKPAKA
ncbi:MAG: hypothetical protein IPH44_32425 [Myxococcales bacterium]|nr:hypothetical protein [Myxococcales bacterium]MBP6848818.1 hypothetical protein [Kofleriaceae bacterium]